MRSTRTRHRPIAHSILLRMHYFLACRRAQDVVRERAAVLIWSQLGVQRPWLEVKLYIVSLHRPQEDGAGVRRILTFSRHSLTFVHQNSHVFRHQFEFPASVGARAG